MLFSRAPRWDKIKKIKWDNCNGNIFKKLSLYNIDMDMKQFNNLKLSYNNLQIDLVGTDTNVPITCRRYSNYNIDVSNPNKFIFTDNKITLLKQNTIETKTFLPLDYRIIDEDLKDLLTQITAVTLYSSKFNKNIKTINMAIHQVRLITYPYLLDDIVDESFHSTEADTIIPALIVNKHNIQNDKSVIYDKDNKILNTKLYEGEFIFQDNRYLSHYNTPIKTNSTNKYIGYRDIIGFDFIYS